MSWYPISPACSLRLGTATRSPSARAPPGSATLSLETDVPPYRSSQREPSSLANEVKFREARASLGHSVTRDRTNKDPRPAESNVDRASSTTRFGLTPSSQRANASAPAPGLGPAPSGAAASAPGRSATRTFTAPANARSSAAGVPVLGPRAPPQPPSTPATSRAQVAAHARSTRPTRPQRPRDIRPDAASRAVPTVSSSAPATLHL
jgi:hypothetical protein